jgi:hypothetical protein
MGQNPRLQPPLNNHAPAPPLALVGSPDLSLEHEGSHQGREK